MNNFVGNVSNYMSYLNARRSVISNNVANANTPGYKAKDVTFSNQLERMIPSAASGGNTGSMYRTNSMHLPSSSQQRANYEIRTRSGSVNHDGNGVDVTNEMVELVKTNHVYSVAINAINTQYAINQAARGK